MVAQEKGNRSYRDEHFSSRSTGAHRVSSVHARSADLHVGGGLPVSPLFSGLSPCDYKQISAAARVKEFKRGEVLHVQGDTVRQVLLIVSGIVKTTKLGSSGAEVILRLNGPGDVIVEGNPFCTGEHGTTAQVFRLCQALVWDALVFKARVEPFPILHQNMARIVGSHLLELEERFREMATERVGPRVARQVVRLMEQIGRSVDGTVEIGLSREEMAQMTGTTLFTVSRLFSAWESAGILVPRREAVAISNVPALLEIAAGN